MVREAEMYKEEDEKTKEKIEAKNALENYCYSIKSSIREEKVSSALGEEDKKTVETAVENAIKWLESHPDSGKEAYAEKQKEIEGIVMPIMQKLGGAGGQGGEMPQGGPQGF